MKIEEIVLSEEDSKRLADLLEISNKGLPFKDKRSLQQYAVELLSEAIYFKWKMMKSI